ncbi:MAG: hypothetical protein CVV42_08330 [Candidatus Riflebacteria bacterium HGW-Riflebacteria-2]|nr:MAG: hypothetical protein CVV42_08330 [Candidatus Riflebacteria bacterium HGW-Riflebacteria-2]
MSASACISTYKTHRMEKKPANHELNAAEQLDALEIVCRSLAAVLKKRADEEPDGGMAGFFEQLEGIDFAYLRRQLGGEPDTLSMLAELKSVTQEKDQKIIEFKTSLADLVVENRNLQKQHQALQDRFNSLNSQLNQMQLHSKDLSLKHSAATANLEAREKELETANSELQELRARSYHLKSLCADYEDQIKKQEQELSATLAENSCLKQSSEKAVSDLDHVANSNRQLRLSLESLQQRESELENTIDALQREKNHVQMQLNRMLTGLNKMAVYQQPDNTSQESSLLEPRTLAPYLPFCFPERLPAAISFRREIRLKQPASLQRRKLPAPKSFSQFSGQEEPVMPAHIRTQAARMKTSLKKPFEMKFHAVYRVQPKLSIALDVGHTLRFNDDFALLYKPPVSYNTLQTTSSRTVTMLISRKLREDEIFTRSYNLFMNYLIREIVERNFKSDDLFTITMNAEKAEMEKPGELKNTNIFLETLAFRHRFQLQSQRIKMADASFNYSFKRSNRLKSVLEMFGNTINSMVQKYDIVAAPRHGNSEPEK